MDINQIRALAGMSYLGEAKKKKEIVPPADDVVTDPVDPTAGEEKPAKGKKEKTDEEKLQEMLEKMAKKAEGKDADALIAIFRNVYDAGVKDGIAQANDSTAVND